MWKFLWKDRLTDRQTLWFTGNLHFQKDNKVYFHWKICKNLMGQVAVPYTSTKDGDSF